MSCQFSFILDFDFANCFFFLFFFQQRFFYLQNQQRLWCPNIQNLIHLSYIRNKPLTAITRDTFSALAAKSELAVSQHEICECYVPDILYIIVYTACLIFTV